MSNCILALRRVSSPLLGSGILRPTSKIKNQTDETEKECRHQIYTKSELYMGQKIDNDEDLRCIENCASETTDSARDEVVEEFSL